MSMPKTMAAPGAGRGAGRHPPELARGPGARLRRLSLPSIPGHGGRLVLTTRMRLLIIAQGLIFYASLQDEETIDWLGTLVPLSKAQAALAEGLFGLVLFLLWGLCMIAWMRVFTQDRRDADLRDRGPGDQVLGDRGLRDQDRCDKDRRDKEDRT
ncbi:hypothetical protein M2324_002143 [Rhodovulum sulfidophilum]|uniref:hypothetical protein n=1 Tax=Rhodovulum sulfidophilum TaxID=35806 RepID=UPI000B258093|nr:hypothetical protein [Rhodovulum sulfidophilum]MCW2303741.1 hypothetical protein [Rhodovulum sulfidophilum]